MGFMTPNFGLNKERDAEIISPELNELDEAEAYLYVEDLDGIKQPREYKQPINRKDVILSEGQNSRLILTAEGKIRQE